MMRMKITKEFKRKKNKGIKFWIIFFLLALIASTLLIGSILLICNYIIGLVFIQIALALIYVSASIFILYNIFNTNRKRSNNKNQTINLIKNIVTIIVLIVTLPFYIKWLGLDACNYNIFLTTYSALVSGGLTLIGVAWTINSTEKRRKDDEKKKAIPYLQIIDENNDNGIEATIRIDLSNHGFKKIDNKIILFLSLIKGDCFVFDSIEVNGQKIELSKKIITNEDVAKLIIKNISNNPNDTNIKLLGRDKFNTLYSYKLIDFETIELPIEDYANDFNNE